MKNKTQSLEDQDSIPWGSRLNPFGTNELKIQTSAGKRILREYSFKTQSFKVKDRVFPFCNDFSEILGTHAHWQLDQDSILVNQNTL